MPSPAQGTEITIAQYICHLAAHWRMVATVTVAAAAVAGGYSVLVIPQAYSARGSVIATGQLAAPPRTLEGLLQGLKLEMMEAPIKPEVEMCKAILQSRSVRERLVKEHELGALWAVTSQEAALETLEKRTRLETQEPNLLTIQVRLSGMPRVWAWGQRNDKIRRLSASLVNSYIKALTETLSRFHLSAAKRKRVFLKKKRAQTREQLNGAEEALQRWESDHTLISADDARRLATEELVKLQARLAQTGLELKATGEEIARATELLREQPQMRIASLEQEANPLILQLRERLIQLHADLVMAQEVRGETEFHPEVAELHQQIEATQQPLAQEQRQQMFTSRRTETHNPAIERLLEQLLPLQIKREALAAKSEGLTRALRAAEDAIKGLSAQAMHYGRLLREVRVREAVYQAVVNEYEQALIAEQAD